MRELSTHECQGDVAAGPNMSNFSRFQNAQLIEAKFATEELRHDV